ncbi:ANTAR domain-containing protein [Nakamurella sp. GG22]
MDFPLSLADDLDVLTQALGDPVLDLGAVLGVLTDDLLAVVPSYLGLSMTLQVDRTPVTFTFLTAAGCADVRASLWLPLVPPGAPGRGGNVVFFAATSGAFRDLADDARWMFTLYGQAVLDGHLPSAGPAGREDSSSLGDFSDINQAIGVLIAMGHAAPEAQDELHRRARSCQRTLLETARDLLGTVGASGDGREQ